MFFAGLFAMYFTLRGADPEAWAEKTPNLNVPFAAVNTTVLVLSSFTCQTGVWAAERYQPVAHGSLIQFRAGACTSGSSSPTSWAPSSSRARSTSTPSSSPEGLTISSSPYGSVFYLTTGFHGLHVLGGLIAMLFVLGRSFVAKKFGHHEATTTIVVSYYWHFVDVVWIALFTVIYLMK